MVESAPLLREYGLIAHRGFESLPLRQSFVSLLWWDFSIADLPAEAHRWRAFRDAGLGSVGVCEVIALLEAPIIEIFSVARCRGSLSVETDGLISR